MCAPQSEEGVGTTTSSPPVSGDPGAVCVTATPPTTCAALPAGPLTTSCGPVTLATSHEMLLWGPAPGVCSSSQVFTDIAGAGAVYDTTAGSWSAISTAGAPVWRAGALLFMVGRQLVILGGRGYEGNRQRYNLDTKTWTSNNPNGDANRVVVSSESLNTANGFSFTTAFVVGGLIVVLPGQLNTAAGTLGNGDPWLYDPGTDKWTMVPAFPLAARNSASIAVSGSKLIVWGGTSLDGSQIFADGAVLDTVANHWTAIPSVGAPSARFLIRAAADPASTSVFFFGGWPSGTDWTTTAERDDGAVFDVASAAWTAIPAGPHPPTLAQRLTWHVSAFGNRLVTSRSSSSTITVYDATARAWTTLADLPCAAQQNDALTPLAIYKNKLLVAGVGIGGLSLYDLGTGGGVNLDGATSPVARTGASVVWVTDRLVVWGGAHYQRTCFGNTPASCQTTGTRFANGFTLTW